MARLIAASDLILTTRLSRDAAATAGAVKEPDYVSIPLEPSTVLKGMTPEKPVLRHYVDPKSVPPASKALMAASGRPVTLFLVLAEGGPHLVSEPQFAIRDADTATVNVVRAELARQTTILRHWQIDRDLPHFGEVGRLVHRLGNGPAHQQHETFAALEKLGVAAVPAIVAQMDDRRPLVEQRISLVNHAPDAFEGIRHYGPEQVVDALAAILNQITDVSFAFIYNGGSDGERRAAVDAWRIYVADLSCAPGGAAEISAARQPAPMRAMRVFVHPPTIRLAVAPPSTPAQGNSPGSAPRDRRSARRRGGD